MKIAFMGAGSTIFAKNIIGDCILTPEFGEFEVFLHDIDPQRLEDSERILKTINKTHNGKATIRASLNRREALKDADVLERWLTARDAPLSDARRMRMIAMCKELQLQP